jgi:hypothetical protein
MVRDKKLLYRLAVGPESHEALLQRISQSKIAISSVECRIA